MEANLGGISLKMEKGSALSAVSVEARADMVFIKRAFAYFRKIAFPDTRLPFGVETVAAFVPSIKLADDGYVIGVRRPDRKVRTRVFVWFHDVGAEFVIQAKVAALVE